ncbi:MAG: hypothetical protein LUC88_00215 [Prevotella sp.]|nr:hypothetical protein [Prevotella sp.]
MKVKFLFLLGIFNSIICLSACANVSKNDIVYDIQPDSAVYATLGKTMTEVLLSPQKVTCYTIKGKQQVDEGDYELEPHYVRDSYIAKLNAKQIGILQFELISDEQNYSIDSVRVRSPYAPAVEFCFEKKKTQVHVIISLSNFTWTIFYDDKRQGNWNYSDKRFMERYCYMILGEVLKKIK